VTDAPVESTALPRRTVENVRLAAVTQLQNFSAWAALGFTVDDDTILLPNGALRPADPGAGYHGLVTGDAPAGATHPNGAVWLDHVVITTPTLDATSAEVEAVLGLPRRRLRETSRVRQAFHRFDPVGEAPGCIVELVESPHAAAAAFWGLVVVVDDLAGVCRSLGPDVIGAPKPAVQPDRQIATLRSAAGLGFPVALMTPEHVPGTARRPD